MGEDNSNTKKSGRRKRGGTTDPAELHPQVRVTCDPNNPRLRAAVKVLIEWMLTQSADYRAAADETSEEAGRAKP
jgi:hypothetical protein